MDSPFVQFFGLIVLIFSVIIHEVSHGVMALSMGDTTAKDAGRLTLNPIPHIDLFGSILLPLFFYITHSPIFFGYAKPVPYNPLNLNDRRFGPIKVALAGPLSNIALAVLFGIAYRVLSMGSPSESLLLFLQLIIYINLALAVFNIIPIPPLDGHWLLMPFLSMRQQMFLYRYGFLFLLLFIFYVFPRISFVIPALFRLITGVA